MTLRLDNNFAQPDDAYQAIIDAHLDLSDAQSQALNAQLILLLANHIGDATVLSEALKIARDNVLTT